MNVTLSLPRALLQSKRKDAVTLLRLAAGANAMEVAVRLLLSLGTGQGRVAGLCRIQSFIIALAYLREIVKTIEATDYEDRLFTLAEIGLTCGVELGKPLTEMRPLLSPVHPDIGRNVLLKIRDKIGFHWDPKPFEAFLDDPDADSVIVWETEGDANIDRIFTASVEALSRFCFNAPENGKALEDIYPAFMDATVAVGHVIEAAFVGLLVESGEDLSKYLKVKG